MVPTGSTASVVPSDSVPDHVLMQEIKWCLFFPPLPYNVEVRFNTVMNKHQLELLSHIFLKWNSCSEQKFSVMERKQREYYGVHHGCHMDATCLHLDMHIMGPKSQVAAPSPDGAWKYCELAPSHNLGTWQRPVLAPASALLRQWQKLGPGQVSVNYQANVVGVLWYEKHCLSLSGIVLFAPHYHCCHAVLPSYILMSILVHHLPEFIGCDQLSCPHYT